MLVSSSAAVVDDLEKSGLLEFPEFRQQFLDVASKLEGRELEPLVDSPVRYAHPSTLRKKDPYEAKKVCILQQRLVSLSSLLLLACLLIAILCFHSLGWAHPFCFEKPRDSPSLQLFLGQGSSTRLFMFGVCDSS